MEKKDIEVVLAEIKVQTCDSCGRDLYEKAIVAWRQMRTERLELERQARKTQDMETALKSWTLEVFKQQNLEGCLIDGRITKLTTNNVPTVSDKEALVKYILETGEIDLLQFRLAGGAVKERKDNDISVPGTEFIDVYDLSDKQA